MNIVPIHISLINGLILLVIGLYGYLGSEIKPVTALIPVIFGVLTVLTYDQAIQRIQKNESNKGFEAALTAVKTVRLMQQIS